MVFICGHTVILCGSDIHLQPVALEEVWYFSSVIRYFGVYVGSICHHVQRQIGSNIIVFCEVSSIFFTTDSKLFTVKSID